MNQRISHKLSLQTFRAVGATTCELLHDCVLRTPAYTRLR